METPPAPTQLLLTTLDAARLLSVSPRTIARLTSSGEIKPTKVGSRLVRYTPADLEAFIARQTRIGPDASQN